MLSCSEPGYGLHLSDILLWNKGRGLSGFTFGNVSISRLKMLYNYYFVRALCTTNVYAMMKDLFSYLTEETFVVWEAWMCDVLGCFFTLRFPGFVSDTKYITVP